MRFITVEFASTSIDCIVRTDADLDGVFDAIRLDDCRPIKIKGWQVSIVEFEPLNEFAQ